MKPYFTIGIPVYNRPTYLKEAVNSVLKNSFQDFELIISDDHSDSKTISYLKSLNNPKIHVLYSESRIGMVNNWKKLIDSASGKYIKLLMSDDIIFPNTLKITHTLLKKYELDYLVSSGYIFFDEININDKEYIKLCRQGNIDSHNIIIQDSFLFLNEKKCFKYYWSNPNAYTIRADILKNTVKTNKFKEANSLLGQTGHCIDTYLLYESVLNTKTKILKVNQPLYGLRFHKNNASKKYSSDLLYHLEGDRYINYTLFQYRGLENFYIFKHAIIVYLDKLVYYKNPLFLFKHTGQLFFFMIHTLINIFNKKNDIFYLKNYELPN